MEPETSMQVVLIDLGSSACLAYVSSVKEKHFVYGQRNSYAVQPGFLPLGDPWNRLNDGITASTQRQLLCGHNPEFTNGHLWRSFVACNPVSLLAWRGRHFWLRFVVKCVLSFLLLKHFKIRVTHT